MPEIGKLIRVPLRDVWKHEEYDFTVWLTENPDVLSESIGIQLSNVEREQAAGDFTADMRAEDEEGNIVVIENQLAKSNHDHLGKLVTYVSAFGAKCGVWIVSDPRPEHIAAINWLNESPSASFFMLKIEAVKIQDSPPAPLLTLITGPSAETTKVGEIKQEVAGRYSERRAFWEALLERSKARTRLFSNVSAGKYSWIATGSGRAGITYNYVIWQTKAAVEVYIDRKDADENEKLFNELRKHATEIELGFGGTLDWQPLENRQACRVRYSLLEGGYRSPVERWPVIHDAMIDAMIRLEKAFRPHIAKLDSPIGSVGGGLQRAALVPE